jgi:predicted nucleic acid-binding protein
MAYILDSGFLYARLNGKDFAHDAVSRVVLDINETVYFPVPAISEVTYLLQRDLGYHAVWEFIDELNETNIRLESPVPSDYTRAADVLRNYNDANIDFVDACIVAMAERLNIRKVLTIDQRHFRIFRPRHCDSFELLPD